MFSKAIVLVFYCRDKKQLFRPLSKVKSRNPRQRPWKTGLLLLLVHFTFLYGEDHPPSGGTIHSGLESPVSFINQENVLQAFLQAKMTEDFSQLRLLFLDDSTLHPTDKKLTRTPV